MTAAPLWTAREAAAATGGRNSADWRCAGIVADSRRVAPGDLFVALRGPRFDGHDYVARALAEGAAAALVSRRPNDIADDAPLLVVDDVLAALTRLAAAARARSAAQVVAVTGSVGKTGTKEALKLALGVQAPTHVSPASFNNHWGVPLALAALPREARFAVFELGMNHAGEIGPLSRLVRPHVAVITTVEAVHTAYFPSLAAIADAKAEVFEGMDADGVLVGNKDNPFHARLAAAARARGLRRVVCFGDHPHAGVRLTECRLGTDDSQVEAEIEGRAIAYTVGAPGRHWVINSLAVLGAVAALGADLDRAAAALADLRALPGRGARERVALDDGGFVLIDESYNANPTSTRAAIEVLGNTPPAPGGRRIAVLGDMLELGADAAERHAGLAPALTRAGVDLVFTVGPNMACLRAALPAGMRACHAERATNIVAPVVAAVAAGDVVMVKGSLGTAMAPVVAALRERAGAAAPRAAG